VERTGARAYLRVDAGVEFDHHALADGDEVEMATPSSRSLTPGTRPLTTRTWSRISAAERAIRAGVHRRLAADR